MSGLDLGTLTLGLKADVGPFKNELKDADKAVAHLGDTAKTAGSTAVAGLEPVVSAVDRVSTAVDQLAGFFKQQEAAQKAAAEAEKALAAQRAAMAQAAKAAAATERAAREELAAAARALAEDTEEAWRKAEEQSAAEAEKAAAASQEAMESAHAEALRMNRDFDQMFGQTAKKVEGEAEDIRKTLKRALAVEALSANLSRLGQAFGGVAQDAFNAGASIVQGFSSGGLVGVAIAGLSVIVEQAAKAWNALEQAAKDAAEAAAAGHRTALEEIEKYRDAIRDTTKELVALRHTKLGGDTQATALSSDLKSAMREYGDAARSVDRWRNEVARLEAEYQKLAHLADVTGQRGFQKQADAKAEELASARAQLATNTETRDRTSSRADSLQADLEKKAEEAARAWAEKFNEEMKKVRDQWNMDQLAIAVKKHEQAVEAQIHAAQKASGDYWDSLTDSERELVLKEKENADTLARQADMKQRAWAREYDDDERLMEAKAEHAQRVIDLEVRAAQEADRAWQDTLDNFNLHANKATHAFIATANLGTDNQNVSGGVLAAVSQGMGPTTQATIGGAVEGGSTGGAYGAIAGAIIGLISQSKGFASLMAQVETVFQLLSDSLGGLLEPITPLIYMLSMLAKVVMPTAQIVQAMTPAFWVLYNVLRVLTSVITFISSATTWAFQQAVNKFYQFIAWLVSFFDDAKAKEIRDKQKDIGSFTDYVGKATDAVAGMSYEQAMAAGKVMTADEEKAKAADDAAAAMRGAARGADKVNESLTNIPQGFKVAFARYAAQDAVPLPTGHARGGIVASPTFAMLGEAGPEAVIPLKQSAGLGAAGLGGLGTTINIGTLVLQGVQNVDEFLGELKRRARLGNIASSASPAGAGLRWANGGA